MNCALPTPGVNSPAGLPPISTCDSAQRFSALMETVPPPHDVYVNGQSHGNGKNQLVEFMSHFDVREFQNRALQHSDAVTSGYPGERRGNPVDEFRSASHEAVAAQADMLRTMMMMEMMSTAKQGVTTLFQQQG